jgi:hypothetical protein
MQQSRQTTAADSAHGAIPESKSVTIDLTFAIAL